MIPAPEKATFNGPAPWLQNCWYQAAWSHELAAAPLLTRRILDRDVLLFRDTSGAARAIEGSLPASICAAVGWHTQGWSHPVRLPRPGIQRRGSMRHQSPRCDSGGDAGAELSCRGTASGGVELDGRRHPG